MSSPARTMDVRLVDYLESRLPGDGPLEGLPLAGGLSNQLFKLTRANAAWVARCSPLDAAARRTSDVIREAEIVGALDQTSLPILAPVVVCNDDGVIGVPFYVMPFADGCSVQASLPPAFDNPEAKQQLAWQMIDTLAALHAVDPYAVGLGHIGRPEGFTARQVDRWISQFERDRVRELPDLDVVAAWLRDRIPEPQRVCLIHGDFGLHNVLFHLEPPPRLQAVLDWETATLGDPLLDVGHFLSTWSQGEDHARWFGARSAIDLEGFPSAATLAERYAAHTGLSIASLAWYRALARLRIAVILESKYVRHVQGRGDRAAFASLEQRVPNIAAQARAIIEGWA